MRFSLVVIKAFIVKFNFILVFFIFLTPYSKFSYAQILLTPLIQMEQFKYIGGFRVPNGVFGDSRASYSPGIITLGASNTMFLVGHTYQQAIAEISIPEIVNDISLQNFKGSMPH